MFNILEVFALKELRPHAVQRHLIDFRRTSVKNRKKIPQGRVRKMFWLDHDRTHSLLIFGVKVWFWEQ